MTLLARSMPLSRLAIAGEHDFRLSRARADETINVKKGEEIRGPFDAVILAVGNGQAAQQGLSLIRAKGRLVIFSAVNDPTPIDLLSVHVKELEIVGACNDEDRFDEAVARIAAEPEAFERIVTHHFPINQFSEAFDLAANGHDRALKVGITIP
jgi:threonine dehydrogenase-like Zn-dependent dehydrogenase